MDNIKLIFIIAVSLINLCGLWVIAGEVGKVSAQTQYVIDNKLGMVGVMLPPLDDYDIWVCHKGKNPPECLLNPLMVKLDGEE